MNRLPRGSGRNLDRCFVVRNAFAMVRKPEPTRFGDVLRRIPDSLSASELAEALRVPVTTIADGLRRRSRDFPVTSPQARVLSQLSLGDSLSVSVLAQSQGLAVSSMTESISRLAEAGLVRKEQSVDDRREVKVSITKEGQRRLSRALSARTAQLTGAVEQLTDAEREAVAAALPALWKLADLDPDIWPRVRSPRGTAARRPVDRNQDEDIQVSSDPEET
jgi:DNA-binding MarR family transcriptional regulator